MVALPFLAMILCIIEVGVDFLFFSQIDYATHKAAQEIRSGSVQIQNLTSAQFKTNVLCPKITGLTCSSLQVNVVVIKQSEEWATWSPTSINPATAKWCPGGSTDTVLMQVAYPVPLGIKMKLRSAQAVIYYAWSQSDAEAWLARAEPPPSPDKTQLMFDSMEFAREHGFTVLVRNPGVVFGEPNDELLSSADTDELPVVPVAAIDPASAYPVAALMAPVFDAKGKVVFTLVMAGFHTAMTGAQALEAGKTLHAACERISGFVAGRGLNGAATA